MLAGLTDLMQLNLFNNYVTGSLDGLAYMNKLKILYLNRNWYVHMYIYNIFFFYIIRKTTFSFLLRF